MCSGSTGSRSTLAERSPPTRHDDRGAAPGGVTAEARAAGSGAGDRRVPAQDRRPGDERTGAPRHRRRHARRWTPDAAAPARRPAQADRVRRPSERTPIVPGWLGDPRRPPRARSGASGARRRRRRSGSTAAAGQRLPASRRSRRCHRQPPRPAAERPPSRADAPHRAGGHRPTRRRCAGPAAPRRGPAPPVTEPAVPATAGRGPAATSRSRRAAGRRPARRPRSGPRGAGDAPSP